MCGIFTATRTLGYNQLNGSITKFRDRERKREKNRRNNGLAIWQVCWVDARKPQ